MTSILELEIMHMDVCVITSSSIWALRSMGAGALADPKHDVAQTVAPTMAVAVRVVVSACQHKEEHGERALRQTSVWKMARACN